MRRRVDAGRHRFCVKRLHLVRIVSWDEISLRSEGEGGRKTGSWRQIVGVAPLGAGDFNSMSWRFVRVDQRAQMSPILTHGFRFFVAIRVYADRIHKVEQAAGCQFSKLGQSNVLSPPEMSHSCG